MSLSRYRKRAGIIKIADYEAIWNECSLPAVVSPNLSAKLQLISGSSNCPSSITCVSPDYPDIRKLSIGYGEIFSEDDIISAAKVSIIGKTIAYNIFPNGEDPIEALRYE